MTEAVPKVVREDLIKALVEQRSKSVFELLKSMKYETDRIFQQIELDAKVSKIRVKEIALELGINSNE
jgi:hypothetical protein